MFKINIITPFGKEVFGRQNPNQLIDKYEFFENGDPEREYNLIVVYESINKISYLTCDARNTIFITGEPPISRVYTEGFLSQFSHIISSHKNFKHKNTVEKQQALPWHIGFNHKLNQYDKSHKDYSQMKPPEKTKKISIISSDKKIFPGHKSRFDFVTKLRNEFSTEIDFFGNGINQIDDKADGILPYYMTICIENSSHPNYWTEKISDAYIGYSLPIYFGCTNIADYFPSTSLFSINIANKKESFSTIDFLLNNCQELYSTHLASLLEARNLVLNVYNIYPTLIDFIETNKLLNNNKPELITLLPNNHFKDFQLKTYFLRAKRFLQK